jgi:hypothetical protein
VLAAATAGLSLAGCGGGSTPAPFDRPGATSSGPSPTAEQIGFPGLATKNTIRVAGVDAVTDAAAISQAVFPSRAPGTRPTAVALTDGADWHSAIAASVLMSAPIRAPLILGAGTELPATATQALQALAPSGSTAVGGAQLIRVGNVASPKDLKATSIRSDSPFAVAAAIDKFVAAAAGRTSDAVLVVSADEPRYAMPAAGWAAKSGDSILFVTRHAIPAATRTALARHQHPRIYVLAPPSVIDDKVVKDLGKLGPARRAYDTSPKVTDPVSSAIAFARFRDADFGWGIRDPGHGLVFASLDRPLDAGAAAPLSASGSYGPLLLLPRGDAIPAVVQNYLLDIEPGYTSDPVRGVYNRAWLIGDTRTLSLTLQASVDRLLEIAPVKSKQP